MAMRVNAYILAGGRSSRMGRDKARLELGGERLLERAVRQARAVAERVSIVAAAGDNADDWPVRVICDRLSEAGPLAGIFTALHDSHSEWNLILAVDQVVAPRTLLELLIRKASEAAPNCHVVVPMIAGRLQPLCAVYHKRFAMQAWQGLQMGDRKIAVLFEEAKALIVSDDDLKDAGIDTASLYNVNTPEEFEAAKRALECAAPEADPQVKR